MLLLGFDQEYFNLHSLKPIDVTRLKLTTGKDSQSAIVESRLLRASLVAARYSQVGDFGSDSFDWRGPGSYHKGFLINLKEDRWMLNPPSAGTACY